MSLRLSVSYRDSYMVSCMLGRSCFVFSNAACLAGIVAITGCFIIQPFHRICFICHLFLSAVCDAAINLQAACISDCCSISSSSDNQVQAHHDISSSHELAGTLSLPCLWLQAPCYTDTCTCLNLQATCSSPRS